MSDVIEIGKKLDSKGKSSLSASASAETDRNVTKLHKFRQYLARHVGGDSSVDLGELDCLYNSGYKPIFVHRTKAIFTSLKPNKYTPSGISSMRVAMLVNTKAEAGQNPYALAAWVERFDGLLTDIEIMPWSETDPYEHGVYIADASAMHQIFPNNIDFWEALAEDEQLLTDKLLADLIRYRLSHRKYG